MNIKTTAKLILLVLAVYIVLWWAYHWSQGWRSRLKVSEAMFDLDDGFRQLSENGSVLVQPGDRAIGSRDPYRFWKVFLSRLRRAAAASVTSSWLQFGASEIRELSKWHNCHLPGRTADELLSCDAQFYAMLAGSPPTANTQVRRAFRSTGSMNVKLPLQIDALLTPLTHLSSSPVPRHLSLVLWHLDILLDLRLFMHTVGRRLTVADHPQLFENLEVDESFDGKSVLALISAVPPYTPSSHSKPLQAYPSSSVIPHEALSSITGKLQVLGYLLANTDFFEAVQDPGVLAHFALMPEHLPLSRTFVLRDEKPTISIADRFYDSSSNLGDAFRAKTSCNFPLATIRRLRLLHESHPSLSLGAFLTESLSFDPISPASALGHRFFAQINEHATSILRYVDECNV